MSEEINVETSLVKVGAVGVDSGRIMLLDPCNEGKRTGDAGIGSMVPAIDGVRSIRRGSVEIGIMAQTPGGDGVFPVIAEVVDGKLNGLLLDFGDDDLEKGILGARMIARGEVEPEIIEAEITHLPPEAWQGTPPAQGSRRALLRDTLLGFLNDVAGKEMPGGPEDFALAMADSLEAALLGSGDDGREADAQEAINAVGEALDRIDAPQGATYAERIDRLYREMRDRIEQAQAVADLLKDFGIARACRPCAEEEIEQGRKEAGDRRDDTIKSLSLRCDSLLAQREQARGGEDHFKAQRDAALHLVRWLIGDLIPPGLVEFAGEDES